MPKSSDNQYYPGNGSQGRNYNQWTPRRRNYHIRLKTGPVPNSQSGFRLHYFPDIPVDDPDNVRVCAYLEDKFQRVRYDDGESNCPDLLFRLTITIKSARIKIPLPPADSMSKPIRKGLTMGWKKAQMRVKRPDLSWRPKNLNHCWTVCGKGYCS